MIRNIVVALVLSLCASLPVLCSQFQPPPSGAVHPIVMEAPPDLVVEEVTYEMTAGIQGRKHYQFTIVVKNVGSGDASAGTITAVAFTYNLEDGHFWTNWALDTPAIAAGSSTAVSITLQRTDFPRTCIVIIVDAPTLGSPLGQRFEGPGDGELNNGFVFFLNPDVPGPQTFRNPAVNE
jgi:hypothetical protein